MKKILLFSFIGFSAHAGGGLFFNVTGSTTSMSISSNIPNHTYKQAGIKLNPGFTLLNPESECTSVNKYGYCIFEISNLAPKTLSITGSGSTIGATICLNGNGPVSCQHYSYTSSVSSIADYVYVVNSTGPSSTGFISLCQADSSGTLSNCQPAGETNPCSTASDCSPRSITFDGLYQYAYISYHKSESSGPSASIIQACEVNASTKTLSNCQFTSLPDMSTFPNQIAYVKLGTQGYIYTVTGEGGFGGETSIYRCEVDNILISNCTNTNPGISSLNLTGIAINPNAVNMYVSNNSGNQLVNCTINDSAGSITCDTLNPVSVSNNPEFISLDVGGTPAFIPFFVNGVQYFPISGSQITSTGSGVAKSSASFSQPNQSTPNSAGTYAFVSNRGNNEVSICSINSDNTFDICQTSAETFYSPFGITVIPNVL